ncbi:MAG: hypothetical protein N0E59_02150 [Candidatus Thiodiazotropha taylori]|nr:hypothetical protein [Candidatus Thiodiazotropha taylori]MCG8051908.1 hypothetical protein [Candidatus Thiodiazotropha taylori]MCG8108680.1 hypothetical protein [Candidatus Thiodiazotropha taylori]MCG8109544.1 hypothetical protein [Candidatus Thiodiazotropha taylori]MCW4281016.1 hypothetical protein [Candidatus Thiodiazotropha taylori]
MKKTKKMVETTLKRGAKLTPNIIQRRILNGARFTEEEKQRVNNKQLAQIMSPWAIILRAYIGAVENNDEQRIRIILPLLARIDSKEILIEEDTEVMSKETLLKRFNILLNSMTEASRKDASMLESLRESLDQSLNTLREIKPGV